MLTESDRDANSLNNISACPFPLILLLKMLASQSDGHHSCCMRVVVYRPRKLQNDSLLSTGFLKVWLQHAAQLLMQKLPRKVKLLCTTFCRRVSHSCFQLKTARAA